MLGYWCSCDSLCVSFAHGPTIAHFCFLQQKRTHFLKRACFPLLLSYIARFPAAKNELGYRMLVVSSTSPPYLLDVELCFLCPSVSHAQCSVPRVTAQSSCSFPASRFTLTSHLPGAPMLLLPLGRTYFARVSVKALVLGRPGVRATLRAQFVQLWRTAMQSFHLVHKFRSMSSLCFARLGWLFVSFHRMDPAAPRPVRRPTAPSSAPRRRRRDLPPSHALRSSSLGLADTLRCLRKRSSRAWLRDSFVLRRPTDTSWARWTSRPTAASPHGLRPRIPARLETRSAAPRDAEEPARARRRALASASSPCASCATTSAFFCTWVWSHAHATWTEGSVCFVARPAITKQRDCSAGGMDRGVPGWCCAFMLLLQMDAQTCVSNARQPPGSL